MYVKGTGKGGVKGSTGINDGFRGKGEWKEWMRRE